MSVRFYFLQWVWGFFFSPARYFIVRPCFLFWVWVWGWSFVLQRVIAIYRVYCILYYWFFFGVWVWVWGFVFQRNKTILYDWFVPLYIVVLIFAKYILYSSFMLCGVWAWGIFLFRRNMAICRAYHVLNYEFVCHYVLYYSRTYFLGVSVDYFFPKKKETQSFIEPTMYCIIDFGNYVLFDSLMDSIKHYALYY